LLMPNYHSQQQGQRMMHTCHISACHQ
jgi:hypothetical protein